MLHCIGHHAALSALSGALAENYGASCGPFVASRRQPLCARWAPGGGGWTSAGALWGWMRRRGAAQNGLSAVHDDAGDGERPQAAPAPPSAMKAESAWAGSNGGDAGAGDQAHAVLPRPAGLRGDAEAGAQVRSAFAHPAGVWNDAGAGVRADTALPHLAGVRGVPA